jgi:hypothetical protein
MDGSGAQPRRPPVVTLVAKPIPSSAKIRQLPLRSEFDADDFLRNMASVASMAAGCEYAVTFQRFTVG